MIDENNVTNGKSQESKKNKNSDLMIQEKKSESAEVNKTDNAK